ncbi:MAG: hypothetical protein HOP07_01950 [Bacteriovoracaceae bacterium]|nr:hypothetical protein [Bacteriovoracaceae bacterium]
MKSIIFTLSLSLALPLFAQDKSCKSEAQRAAYERYQYEFSDSIINVRFLGKPVVYNGQEAHSIIIDDLETGEKVSVGVILEAKTCKVISVN